MVNGQAIGTPTAVGEDAQTAEAHLFGAYAQHLYLYRQDALPWRSGGKREAGAADAGSGGRGAYGCAAGNAGADHPTCGNADAGRRRHGDGSLPMWVLWAVLGVAAVGGGVVLYQKIKRN